MCFLVITSVTSFCIRVVFYEITLQNLPDLLRPEVRPLVLVTTLGAKNLVQRFIRRSQLDEIF